MNCSYSYIHVPVKGHVGVSLVTDGRLNLALVALWYWEQDFALMFRPTQSSSTPVNWQGCLGVGHGNKIQYNLVGGRYSLSPLTAEKSQIKWRVSSFWSRRKWDQFRCSYAITSSAGILWGHRNVTRVTKPFFILCDSGSDPQWVWDWDFILIWVVGIISTRRNREMTFQPHFHSFIVRETKAMWEQLIWKWY